MLQCVSSLYSAQFRVNVRLTEFSVAELLASSAVMQNCSCEWGLNSMSGFRFKLCNLYFANSRPHSMTGLKIYVAAREGSCCYCVTDYGLFRVSC